MSPAVAHPAALAGRHIVVTRPAAQAQVLAESIEFAGGIPVLFPLLEIDNIDDPQPLLAVADRLTEFSLAIFISANAVNKALNIILDKREWPPQLRVATVGKSSERELQHFGIDNVIAPSDRYDSEALLALPGLQAAAIGGKRVVIFRGDGGRELLGDTLTARGARVEYVQCYWRNKPKFDAAPLLQRWARSQIDALTVTSSEGLHNLYDMLDETGRQYLRKTPLFAPHQRIVDAARELGLPQVILTAPGDAGLVEGVTDYFANNVAARKK